MFVVTAAAEFSTSEGYKLKTIHYKLAVVGSSIGANLAIGYAADHFEVRAAALFSPGINYYGLRSDDYFYQYHRPLAVITAKDDPYYADVQKLLKIPGVNKEKIWYQEYETGGHGKKIMDNHPDLLPQLVD